MNNTLKCSDDSITACILVAISLELPPSWNSIAIDWVRDAGAAQRSKIKRPLHFKQFYLNDWYVQRHADCVIASPNLPLFENETDLLKGKKVDILKLFVDFFCNYLVKYLNVFN